VTIVPSCHYFPKVLVSGGVKESGDRKMGHLHQLSDSAEAAGEPELWASSFTGSHA
jgi:hypothetical protein